MSQNGFLEITSIHLPVSCVITALEWMKKMGMKNLEGVALWAGVQEGDKFYIKRTIIPDQKSGSFEDGLLYVVEGSELHRISLELFDTGMQLIAQIHSHPKEAYHSETDDEYPIVTVLGGISIVVPDFAKGGFNFSQWAVYRYLRDTKWTVLTEKQKKSLIEIINDRPRDAR